MAPRALESRETFLKRLRSSWRGEGSDVRFGGHHFTHGVVMEAGLLRVRALVLNEERAEAYRATHGAFMPEHAEMLSEPTGKIVYEASSLTELIGMLEKGPWPL